MLGGQGAVLAIAADRADMDMTETLGEMIKERDREIHRRIERPSVGNVEAKTSLGESLEEAIELDRVAAIALARVHILDRDNSPEGCVGLGVRDRVGMKDDCIDARREAARIRSTSSPSESCRSLLGAWTER